MALEKIIKKVSNDAKKVSAVGLIALTPIIGGCSIPFGGKTIKETCLVKEAKYNEKQSKNLSMSLASSGTEYSTPKAFSMKNCERTQKFVRYVLPNLVIIAGGGIYDSTRKEEAGMSRPTCNPSQFYDSRFNSCERR